MEFQLETVAVIVSEAALEPFEAAFHLACRTVGLFLTDETIRVWTIEGVKRRGQGEAELASGLALAGLITGEDVALHRRPTDAGGWLARTQSSFPEQRVGRRFAIRGTHLPVASVPGRITLVLDAGVAFGSGEHGSTRGCLRALERVAHRRPRRILDLGCGSGILAMAAALAAAPACHRRPTSTHGRSGWRGRMRLPTGCVAGCDAALRRDGSRRPGRGALRPRLRQHPGASALRDGRGVGAQLAAGGTAILAGLLATQARWCSPRIAGSGWRWSAVSEGAWTTLVLRKPGLRRGVR